MTTQAVKVLLVEDNMTDAELVIRALQKNHFTNHLLHVKNGKEAIDFIHDIQVSEPGKKNLMLPKLILPDIQMPKVNGIEFLRFIKSQKETKHIPVVIFTSSKESPDIIKCYEAGTNSYLVKPLNFDAFSTMIKTIGNYWLQLNQPPV